MSQSEIKNNFAQDEPFHQSRIEKTRWIFNEFNGKNLDLLDQYYNEAIVFEDPLHKVEGLLSLKAYYKKMYSNVSNIRFHFTKFHSAHQTLTSEWILYLQAPSLNFGREVKVHGCSILNFGEDHKVIYHRDYFDVGEMVYEKIPVLGCLIGTLKKKLSSLP